MGRQRRGPLYANSLVYEQHAKTPYIKEGAQSIEEQEPNGANTGAPSQGRRQCAQAWKEFRGNYAAHPVAREKILRSTYTRIRLQGNSAEQVQYALSLIAPQIKPH